MKVRALGLVMGYLLAMVCVWSISFDEISASESNTLPNAFVPGILTPIKSRIEGIISNRHQEHMWITTDGGVHVLTAGSEDASNEWTLLSTHDQGITWTPVYQVVDTRNRPKVDGLLSGDTLYVVYSGSIDQLHLLVLIYDEANKLWLQQGTHLLYQGHGIFTAERATISMDSTGQLWFVFTEVDDISGESIIKIYYIDGQFNAIDTGTRLGTLNLSERKSPRILGTGDGLVVIYTDAPDDGSDAYTLNWAYRLNSWAFDDWFHQQIYQLSEADGRTDRHGAHFSSVADSQDNIHIAMRSEDKVRYFRIEDYVLVTPNPQELGEGNPNLQIGVSSDDMLYVAYGSNYGNIWDLIWILQSSDYGQQFLLKDVLYYKPRKNLGANRIEIPAHFDTWIPVMRQIDRAFGFEGLVYFHLEGGIRKQPRSDLTDLMPGK